MISAWAFAAAAWRRPGVEAICLDLQDVHGQCPALLLWRLWAVEQNRAVGSQALARAIDEAREWEDGVLRPLRTVRRRLMPDARISLRRRILDAELEAEHALLDALETLAAEPGAGGGPPLPILVALAQAWRPPAPAPALAGLVEAL